MTKKIQKIIPDKAMAILVIIFALSMLIGGGTYLFAVVTYPLPQVAPNQQLTASAWNNVVDDINDLNSRVNSVGSPNLTCIEFDKASVLSPYTSAMSCITLCNAMNMTCTRSTNDATIITTSPGVGGVISHTAMIYGMARSCDGTGYSDHHGCGCCRVSF